LSTKKNNWLKCIYVLNLYSFLKKKSIKKKYIFLKKNIKEKKRKRLGMTISFKKKNMFWNLYKWKIKETIKFISIGSSTEYKNNLKKVWWDSNIKYKLTKKILSSQRVELKEFILTYKGLHNQWLFTFKAITPRANICLIKIKWLKPHNGCRGKHKRNRRKESFKKKNYKKKRIIWPNNLKC